MTYAMAQAASRARTRHVLRRRAFALASALVAALPLLAVVAGLAGTLLLAFGYPFDDPFAAGGRGASLRPWHDLAAIPGIATSIALTLWTGIGATLVSVALAILVCAWAQGHGIGRKVVRAAAPLLVAPHSAVALGVAMLAAPTGWPVGALAPWLSGHAVPATPALGGDALGLALIAALVLKQTPFLILVIATALGRLPASQTTALAGTLGYRYAEGFAKALLPQIYPRIRMVVLAVLVLSLSVVDVALILGPKDPPTLAVVALRELTAAGTRNRYAGAAAACLLLAIVGAAIALWWSGERVVMALGRAWIERGGRGIATACAARGAAVAVALGFAAGALSLADLAAWSFAGAWPTSAPWPSGLTLAHWVAQGRDAGGAALATLVIAIGAGAIALLLAVGRLEFEDRSGPHPAARRPWASLLPLLVPQVAFLFGIRILLTGTRLDGTWAGAIATQLIVVLPCVYLTLAGPWRELDRRYARSAVTLGAPPRRALARVKLPLLAGPILIACAVGVAASADQYLPALLAGSRGVVTLTTSAVALATGGDRAAIGLHATLQWLLPLLVCAVVLALPVWRGGAGRSPGIAR